MKGKFNKQNQLPPGTVKKPGSVMSYDAVVDATPQKLKEVRPYAALIKDIPSDLSSEAQIVLHALFDCFERQKSVKEGKLVDIVWGFAQCGIAPQCTESGLGDLRKKGYLKMLMPDGAEITEGDRVDQAMVHYTNKLLSIVYLKEER